MNRSNEWGLWVTDGTSAGTSELTVANAYFDGLFDNGSFPEFTMLGNRALFVGRDASLRDGLWVTNGTAAGTRELNVKGAGDTGLFRDDAPDFTVLGHKALFDGVDSNGFHNLWVTDGTAAGTLEFKGRGASGFGLFTTAGELVSAKHFGILENKAIFAGADKSNENGLWVTDGTSAGTSELKVAGANSLGLLAGDNTYDADFISLGAKVLFVGWDADGDTGLWITDGTAAGTKNWR